MIMINWLFCCEQVLSSDYWLRNTSAAKLFVPGKLLQF